MLLMISARAFLAACSAQAGVRKKETGVTPRGDGIQFTDTMDRLAPIPEQKAGSHQPGRQPAMNGTDGIRPRPGI